MNKPSKTIPINKRKKIYGLYVNLKAYRLMRFEKFIIAFSKPPVHMNFIDLITYKNL